MGDNQGPISTPPRRPQTDRWPNRFYDAYGHTLKLLLCPSELTNTPASDSSGDTNLADIAPRSYFMNGWNDAFVNPATDPQGMEPRATILGGSLFLMKENMIIHLPVTHTIISAKNDRPRLLYGPLREGSTATTLTAS